MRIFKTFSEAYHEIERELKHNGITYQSETVQDKHVGFSSDFMTKELTGYTFTVKDPSLNEFALELKLDQDWLDAEFRERISGLRLNPGKAYKLREVWDEFVHGGFFSYTYSGRIGRQIRDVIKLLKKNPMSRHGLINIYWPNVDNQWNRRLGMKRVPCSMYYLVYNRPDIDGIVHTHMIYNIRSNDFVTHFPYDIILARMLQEHIATCLGTVVGDFIYQSGSLHVFYKDNAEIF